MVAGTHVAAAPGTRPSPCTPIHRKAPMLDVLGPAPSITNDDPRGPALGGGASSHAAVFRHEPDLLTGLDPVTADRLARQAVARKHWLEPGAWSPLTDARRATGSLGLLVLEGAAVRSVSIAARTYPELVGPGDLLRPWDHADYGATVPSTSTWRVLQPTVLAVLDPRFAAIVARYPTVVAQLLARATLRTRGLAFSLAVAQVRHADTRLLLLLWHLADRWGRMTPDGALIPMPLTHELLAHLVCLQRPTASSALQRLRRAGRIDRREDGSWLLHGDPPALDGRARATPPLAIAA
jgi:CRP-like cAMP-binding protein